ncbi:MAG: AAA family ATPase [Massiliimalia sp.]|jgi:MoxR-like ATPase
MRPEEIQKLTHQIVENVSVVMKGKEDMIRKTVLCLLCGGHVLLEDIPGTGKTTLAKALAKSVDCGFKRVQFTPDLLPSDLTGINFYDQKEGKFHFKPGSVFTNIMLGDEINRATPRTQSSLLECMEEHQVTVDGVTYPMAQPFFVIATQNPIEIQGTFPLPEAQLDRFFMKLAVGYPGTAYETQMLSEFSHTNPMETLQPVADGETITQAQQAVRQVKVSDPLKEYMVAIADATRNHDKIRLGVSPRGTLALMRGAQAWAAMEGRDYVIPDDVKAVAADVLSHRIIVKGQNIMQSAGSAKEYIRQILLQTQTPIEPQTPTGSLGE